MIVKLSKFGTTLTSRDSGREALSAIQALLVELSDSEELELDFSGVNTFTPSWGDEFLTPLQQKYGVHLILSKTENRSVKATLDMLSEINHLEFTVR